MAKKDWITGYEQMGDASDCLSEAVQSLKRTIAMFPALKDPLGLQVEGLQKLRAELAATRNEYHRSNNVSDQASLPCASPFSFAGPLDAAPA